MTYREQYVMRITIYRNLRCRKITPLYLFFLNTYALHACFHLLTVTPAISTVRLFLLSASSSHTKRAIRTGSSSTAAATVAHFSDDRGRIQARMVNGTALRFLFLFLSFSFLLCYLSFENIWCSVSLAPLGALAFYSEAEAVDRPFPLFLFLFYLYLILTWPRHTPARIPINKKNKPGRPQQNGSSFTRSPSSRLLEAPRQHACTRNACVRARESRLLVAPVYFIYPCTINLRLAPR